MLFHHCSTAQKNIKPLVKRKKSRCILWQMGSLTLYETNLLKKFTSDRNATHNNSRTTRNNQTWVCKKDKYKIKARVSYPLELK
jgi:hypothetical protein